MKARSRLRGALVVGTAVPLAIGMGASTAASAASSPPPNSNNRAVLHGSSPSWAKPDNATSAQPRQAQKPVFARVYLAPRNKDQLDQFVASVSDPSSPSYQDYITPEQYQDKYGPDKQEVKAVAQYLKDAGLHPTHTGPHNRYIVVHGTPSAAQKATGTPLKYYHHDGRTDRAPAHDVSVPKSVSQYVLGFSGLSTEPHTVQPQKDNGAQPPARDHAKARKDAPPPDGFRNARPCSQYYGQLTAKYQGDYETKLPKFQGKYRPYAVCGYTPDQLRGAYGVTGSNLSGRHATVAITDAYAAPTIRSDANKYATRHGDPAFSGGQFSQSTPKKKFRNQDLCGPSGWYGEETLDVEAVHGMATDANVIYYASRSCTDTDFVDTLARVVDDNQASIVSDSWSGTEKNLSVGTIRAYNAIFEQGAAQGIGFFFSSGDAGDEVGRTGTRQVDFPTSDPYVTAVGGTSLGVGAKDNYEFEAGWGTDKYNLSDSGKEWVPNDPLFDYGAGGGFSTVFPRPDYQDGVVPASSPSGRAVPDIAMDADPTTGMLVGETQTFPSGTHYGEYRIGGTSLASPLMAGMQALATQAAGARLGFANPAIYQLARSGSSALRDVTRANDDKANVRPDFVNGLNDNEGIVYSVRTFGDDSSLATSNGWDDVTGVGTPNGKYFSAVGSG